MGVESKRVIQNEPILAARGFSVKRNDHATGGAQDNPYAHAEQRVHKEKKHANPLDDPEEESNSAGGGASEDEKPEEGRETKDGIYLPAGVPGKKKERAVVVVGDGNLKGAFLGDVIDRSALIYQGRITWDRPVHIHRRLKLRCAQLQDRCARRPSAGEG